MEDAAEQQVSCKTLPTLPVDVWARILQLIVSESLYPIQELARLQLINRTVLQAARSVPLSVEVNSPEQLEAIQLFLQACPCAWLRFHKRVDGESLLRHDNFRFSSARSLKELWAVVACTDTLAFFPVLEGLTLEAGAIHRFYPSVLGGLTCLRSLSLVRFPIMELSGLTANVVKTLKEVHITPLPIALRCFFHIDFPRRLHLERFHLHGSFADISGPPMAPVVTCNVETLATQMNRCRIEAQTLRICMPEWTRSRTLRALDLFTALNCKGATWRQLEFRVLDHRIWLEPQVAASDDMLDDLTHLSAPPAVVGLEPEDLLVDAASTPSILATLSWDQAGICRFPVITLLRFLAEDDEDDSCA